MASSPTETATATEQLRQAISRYAAAWLAGDRPALAACYHEDFTLHYFGRNPLAGIHRGKAAALAILAELARRTNRQLLTIVDVMAGPQRGALLLLTVDVGGAGQENDRGHVGQGNLHQSTGALRGSAA